MCSRSQSSVSRRDRVILLGKRQRADGRGKLAEEARAGKNGGKEEERIGRGGERGRGNLQETIFTEFVPEH